MQALAPLPKIPTQASPFISPCGPKGAKCDRPGHRPGCPTKKIPSPERAATLAVFELSNDQPRQ